MTYIVTRLDVEILQLLQMVFFRSIVLNDFVVEIHVELRYQETRELHPAV